MKNYNTAPTSSSDEDTNLSQECQQLKLSLPKKDWAGKTICLYQGFWCFDFQLSGVVAFQRHFKAHDTDIILATTPKSGTTWLKALIFALVNRTRYTFSQHPLLTSNPHELVPFLELKIYAQNPCPDLTNMVCPRLFSTHLAYVPLPESIKNSDCQIVYICRNPLDVCVSTWHFLNALFGADENIPIEKLLEKFLEGEELYGPFFDHVLSYWNESLKRPDKVLFLKYEDLKEDIELQLKRLAEFLGFPFSFEEEKEGMIEKISRLCSLDNLKGLEVNQTKADGPFKYKALFRKGQVGDWTNYLTPPMVERFDMLMQEKLNGSGLKFRLV